MALHVHYRSWCPHCVAGRSTSKQHRRQVIEEPLGITITLDYAFKVAEEVEADTAAVLVAYEHKTKAIWAIEVDAKGVDSGVGANWLVDKFHMAG